MTAHTTRLLPEELERIEYLCKHKGVHPIAVDLAARVFQICYVDLSSGKLCNYQLSRPKFIEFYKSRPDRTLFGFEACGACNYYGREMLALGHEVKVMPAANLKAFLGLDKNDKLDALGILRGLITPSIQSIPPRELSNQLLLNLFTIRENLSKQLTQTINATHGILYELGEVVGHANAKSLTQLTSGLATVKSRYTAPKEASLHLQALCSALESDASSLSSCIKTLDSYLEDYGSKQAACANLCTIPGIGMKTALAIFAEAGDIRRFPSARRFASFLGVAPRVSGTGGKTLVLGLRKNGKSSVKKMLFMCAMVYLSNASRKGVQSLWIKQRLANGCSKKKLICAIMNRMARIAYAVLKTGQPFDPAKSNLVKSLH